MSRRLRLVEPPTPDAAARLLAVLQGEGTSVELAGLPAALEAFRSSTRRARRRAGRLVAAGMTAALPLTGMATAFAGDLPPRVQQVAHRALHRLGVPEPRVRPTRAAVAADVPPVPLTPLRRPGPLGAHRPAGRGPAAPRERHPVLALPSATGTTGVRVRLPTTPPRPPRVR